MPTPDASSSGERLSFDVYYEGRLVGSLPSERRHGQVIRVDGVAGLVHGMVVEIRQGENVYSGIVVLDQDRSHIQLN